MGYTMIVAVSNDYVIGVNGEIPWSLPNDMKFFKKVTTNNTVIMGRKTFESLDGPLPNRTNIILTRDKNFTADGCEVVTSINEIDPLSNGEVFIIGGSEIYSQLLPFVSKVYLTHIDIDIDDMFATRLYDFFPMDWKLTQTIDDDIDNGLRYKILEYNRELV